MSEFTLTATGSTGRVTLSWDLSALPGTSFNLALKQTLNTTTKTIYSALAVPKGTGSFVDSSAVDLAAPNPPALQPDSIKFTTVSKRLSFAWTAAGADIGTVYTYTLEATDVTTGQTATVETVHEVITEVVGYVYKILDTDAETQLKQTDSPTTTLSATVTLPTTTGLKYIHIASYDSVGNVGSSLVTAVDIEAPTAPTTLTVNGQKVTAAVAKPSIPYDPNGFSVDITPSVQVRSMEVLYDISFTVGAKILYVATQTPYCTGIVWEGDILAEIPTLDDSTQFIITVKSYTSVGASLGTKQFIFILNKETVKYSIDWSPNSVNKRFLTGPTDTVKLSWTLQSSDVSITQYEVFYRVKQTEDTLWSSWKTLGKTSNLFESFTGLNLGYNGNNVYSFAVAGVTATGTLPKKILSATYADLFYVTASGTENFTVMVKLPAGVLNGSYLNASYQLSSSSPSVAGNSISMGFDGSISGMIGTQDGVNITTIFPGPRTLGYDFNKSEDVTSFEVAILGALENFRTFPGYSGPPYMDSHPASEVNGYYGILVDIPNTDSRLDGLHYTYDGLIGTTTLGDFTVSYGGGTLQAFSQSIIKSYRLLKMKNIPAPTLVLDGAPEPLLVEEGVPSYKAPVSLLVNLPASMVPYSSSVQIISSYDYNDTTGSGSINPYTPGTPIARVGSITAYAKLRYTYGSGETAIVKESPETSLSFLLPDTSRDLVIPTLATKFVEGATGVDLLVHTNVPDISKYIYIIRDTTGDKQYTTYTTETGSKGLKVLKLRFSKEGTYNITVDYTLEGSGSGSQDISFTVYKFTPATGRIVGLDKVTKKTPFTGVPVHSYRGTTNGLEPESSIFQLRYLGKDYLIKDEYVIPLLQASTLSVSRYILEEAARTGLITLDGREGSTTPVSTMTKFDSQESDLTNILPDTAPPKPTIARTSPNPITGTDPKIEAIDSITFSIGNKNTDLCTYSLFLDGRPLAEGTPVTKSGKHKIVAVANSRYNYLVSTTTLEVEIKTPNLIFPPRLAITPLYDHSLTKTISVLSTVVDGESSTLEYKLSTDNVWKAYSSPVTISQPVTFTARKVFSPSGRTLESSVTITEEMLSKLPAVVPTLDRLKDNNGFISVPAIDEVIGADYIVEVDGVPYQAWSAVKPVLSETSTIKVIATTRRTGDVSAPLTDTLYFDMQPAQQYKIPNLTSSLKMIKFNPNTPLQLNDSTTEATVYIDGKVVKVGQPMFTPATVNGVHTIVIISRHPVNQSIATTSYVININNYSTADSSYSTKTNKRTALLPLNREAGILDTPGELMVDTRTADISVVGEDFQPIEITKGLRTQINSKDQIIGEVNKTIEYIMATREALHSTMESLLGVEGIKVITNVTDRITRDLAKYEPPLRADMKKAKEQHDLSNTLLQTAKGKKGQLESTVPAKRAEAQKLLTEKRPVYLAELRNSTLELLDNVTEVSHSYYNLTTINNIANRKVTNEAFEAFRDKNERIYQDLVKIINEF